MAIDSEDVVTPDLFDGKLNQPAFPFNNEIQDLQSVLQDIVFKSSRSPLLRERARELLGEAIIELARIDLNDPKNENNHS